MEGQETKTDFEVDLSKLVKDLEERTQKINELTEQLEKYTKADQEKEELIKSLTEKTNELEKTNSDLYLKIAQNVVTTPSSYQQEKQEEIKKKSLEDILKEIGEGI